ncbi:DUF6531 domain-containing protein [Halocynthiibacter sp.]|uniref:DUF6531 domain-containing protein n=1 Tax=Halocynthiibacter sp. TaxID=1979210 RepID=UPI003C641C17
MQTASNLNGIASGADSAGSGGGVMGAVTGAFALNGQDMSNVAAAWSDPNISTREAVLQTMESDTFGKGLMYGGAATAAAVGGAAAAVPVAVGAAVGAVAGYAGAKMGSWFAESILGWEKVGKDVEQPATMTHKIAHEKKSLGVWGIIAAAVVGAAVACAVIATGGAALLVVAAAAAAGGLVGGAMSAMGQYGANKGMILNGSPNVFFEGKPVARRGDPIQCSDHPSGPHETGVPMLAEGAETVYANNQQVSRGGHRTTCDGKINEFCTTIAVTMATGAPPLPITNSVPEWLRWAGVASNFIPFPRGGGRGKRNRGGDGDAPPRRPADAEAGTPNNKSRDAADADTATANKNRDSDCSTCKNDPVDVVSGDMIDVRTDIVLPGTIPLELTRFYRSSGGFGGFYGRNWADNWSAHLTLQDESIDYITDEGVTLGFSAKTDEVNAINLTNGRFHLYGQRSSVLRILNYAQQWIYSFAEVRGNKRFLSEIRDRNGNHIRFEYGKDGLSRIIHSDGYELQVVSDRGLLKSVSLSGEALLTAAHKDKCLSEVRALHSGVFFYEYDAHARMIQWRDSQETVVNYRLDDLGRVVETRAVSGHYGGTIHYDDEKRCNTLTYDDGSTEVFYYNQDQLITKQVDQLGRVWETEWDALKNRLKDIDPEGRETCYSYNDYSEIIAVTSHDGSVSKIDYNEYGLIKTVQNGADETWQYTYDDRANLTTTVDPSGNMTRHRYDQNGNLRRSIRDSDKAEVIYRYDDHHRLEAVIDPDGREVLLKHDVHGRLIRSEDGEGGAAEYSYMPGPQNPRGALHTALLPNEARIENIYNSEGLLVRHINGEKQSTAYEYGAFDLLKSIEDPLGGKVCFGYDRNTRLTQVTNESGETWTYTYDAIGRLIREEDFSGRVFRFRYNVRDQLVEKQASGDVHHLYEYSEKGQLLKESVAQGDQSETTEFTYDDKGFLISAENQDACITYDRDMLGRVVSEAINGVEILSEYDPDTGARIARELNGQRSTWNYSPGGRLEALVIGNNAPLALEYDRAGREVLRGTAAGFTQVQEWDRAGQLKTQLAGRHAGASQIDKSDPRSWLEDLTYGNSARGFGTQRRYSYDRAFNPTEIADHRWGTTRYSYNENAQVTKASYGRTALPGELQEEQYNYTAARNIASVAETRSGAAQSLYAPQQDHYDESRFSYASGGRIEGRGDTTYAYDQNGRVISKRVARKGFRPVTWRFAWGLRDQLKRAASDRGEVWHYSYDPFGRRIAKRCSAGPDAGVSVSYLWDGNLLSQQTRLAANGTSTTTSWHFEPGSFRPLAQEVNGSLSYIVTDHLGTPGELFDEAGEVLWSRKGTLWGNTLATRRLVAANDNAGYQTCLLRFQGQLEDEETGLCYNRFRYYDADGGAYLSSDPLGINGGLRSNSYVEAPAGWVDPLGLAVCDARKQRYRELREAGMSVQDATKFSKAGSDGSKLNRAMLNRLRQAGVRRPTKDAWAATHHIVEKADPSAKGARQILAKHGIPLDSADNGVWLPGKVGQTATPGILHNTSHPGAYSADVSGILSNADAFGGKQAVLTSLDRIRNTLSHSATDADWSNILKGL